ncbi:MAG: hypothetical protein AAFO63_06855 [Pseudomonadota bacterium]
MNTGEDDGSEADEPVENEDEIIRLWLDLIDHALNTPTDSSFGISDSLEQAKAALEEKLNKQ